MTSLESVSAVKVIQLATGAGIPIRTVDAANVGLVLPSLNFADEVKTRVADAVAQGRVVTIAEREVVYFNWTGIGWLAEDPSTGAGAYIISEDLRGNVSAYQRDGQNPTCDILAIRLGGDIYRAIAYTESRWRQYATKDGKVNKKGQPYTSGSAFGVMQLERRTWNPSSDFNLKKNRVPKHPVTGETIDWESVLWSWQYNVDLGKAIYDDNLRLAQRFSDANGWNLRPDQVALDALSLYNQFKHYCLPDPVDGTPRVNSENPGVEYADKVMSNATSKAWETGKRGCETP